MTIIKRQDFRARLKVIDSLIDRKKFSLNVGSKEVHFGNNAINIDIDPRFRPNIIVDAIYLPFRSEIYQQILFTDVLEHLTKGTESRAVREIHRVLRYKGELILTTPHNKKMFLLLDPAFYLIGHRHYTLREIRKLLEACGFKIIKIFTSGFFWACINVLWYIFVTYPVKKILGYSLPYAPPTLMSLEDKEYKKIGENGYTIFIKALKQNAI